VKHNLISASLIALLCAAVILLVALWPAHADYFNLGIGGGTAVIHPGPGMPGCNPAVSEECRRLQAKRPAPQVKRKVRR
jgi:hypothetical protein